MSKFFFDVGANQAQTFDWLATQPHDYSDHIFFLLEPSPRHFAALIEKAKAMSGKYQIRLCPFGVSGGTGMLPLYEKDDPMGDSFHGETASDHKTTNISNGYMVISSAVGIGTLLDVVTRPGDSIVLDIDAEGSEYAILKALLARPEFLPRISRIMVEFHFVGVFDCAALKAELLSGFAAHGITIEVRGSVP